MASNIFSRFLPPNAGSPSVYETLQQQDESPDQSDVEDRVGMAVDEENLGHKFQDYELDDALADATESHMATSRKLKSKTIHEHDGKLTGHVEGRRVTSNVHEGDDADDEVPQSLLIEGHQDVLPPARQA